MVDCNWEDESGVKHYRTEIVAQDMIILTPKGDGPSESYNSNLEKVPSATPASKSEEIDPEDLPF